MCAMARTRVSYEFNARLGNEIFSQAAIFSALLQVEWMRNVVPGKLCVDMLRDFF